MIRSQLSSLGGVPSRSPPGAPSLAGSDIGNVDSHGHLAAISLDRQLDLAPNTDLLQLVGQIG